MQLKSYLEFHVNTIFRPKENIQCSVFIKSTISIPLSYINIHILYIIYILYIYIYIYKNWILYIYIITIITIVSFNCFFSNFLTHCSPYLYTLIHFVVTIDIIRGGKIYLNLLNPGYLHAWRSNEFTYDQISKLISMHVSIIDHA